MEALLQLKGIDKAFPGVKALSGAALMNPLMIFIKIIKLR